MWEFVKGIKNSFAVWYANKILITLVFLLAKTAFVCAQTTNLTVTIKNEQGEVVESAHVSIPALGIIAVSDKSGQVNFSNIPVGQHFFQVSVMGYEKAEITYPVSAETKALQIVLKQSSFQIEEAVVVGESTSSRVAKSGYAVTALNPELIAGSSLNTNDLFRSSSGVNLRQTGGFGSSLSVSINGLTGKMVRFFEDGIPIENGYLSPIYLIPFNTIDRIEVYKGVVPEQIGSDALGGAVSFVTRPITRSYTDLSYERGSYELNKAYAGKRFVLNNGLMAGGYFSYGGAKNNYPVEIEISDETGRVNNQVVDRFHDAFKSLSGKLELGFVNRPWADEFYTTLKLNSTDKELQHGLLMQNPAGEAEVSSSLAENRITFKKDGIFKLPFSVELTNVFSLNHINYTDTTKNIYNWRGEITGKRVLGNEIYYFDSPHLADVTTTRNYFKFSSNFQINEKSDLKTTLIYSFFKRTGSDPPAQNENGIDPYDAVPKVHKSTVSISSTNRLADEKLTSITGLKIHILKASQSFSLESNDEINASGNYMGVWQVLRYSPLQNLLFVTSYEYAYRIPDENELFGDVVLISSNTDLEPEKSHNLNLGTIWSYNPQSNLSFNTFFRGIKDIIFLGFPIHGARYTNVFNTHSYGAELEGRTQILNFFHINYALTYQELRNMSNFNYDGTESTKYYNTRLPNIPWLYGNLGLQFKQQNLVGKETESRITLQTFYVNEYYLRPEPDGGGNSKYVIPSQFYQNIGISQKFSKLDLLFGIEVQNVFNHKLYDNFRVQKPGRTLQMLVRYTINN